MDFNRKIIPYLSEWLRKSQRKPLVLRGARQVGKTKAVELFTKRENLDLIEINLEKTEHRRLFQHELTISEFEKIINVSFGKSINNSNTLLFIDEIQEAPHLLPMLRFFYEEKPDLPVIAAGSLLEVKLKNELLSFPVGRIEFAFMFPLDFFEFLEATRENESLKFLVNYDFKEKIPDALHEKFLSLFNDFVLIGGMPEAVATYAFSKNLNTVNEVYSNLFTALKDDVGKYTSQTSAKHVGFILEESPRYAGQTLTFEKFGNSQFRSREMKKSFEILEKAMLLKLVSACKSLNLPLLGIPKKSPKLIFLDTGLINFLSGIQNEYTVHHDLNNIFQGRIAEQVVGQELIAGAFTHLARIYYWYAKTGSEAEVDFLTTYNGKMIGFEVKSGTYGKMKSAQIFLEKTKGMRQVFRIYSGVFLSQQNFISLPFYLMSRWKELVFSEH
jgi:predicted AAA+ superfamily ATPase